MGKLAALKSLAGDSLIYGAAGVVSRFIGVLLVPVYTRVFAPADYGVVSLVMTFTALVNILIILGMDNSLARWYYDDETEDGRKISLNTYLWSCLAAATVFAVLMIVFHEFAAAHLLREERAAAPLLIAACSLPPAAFINFTSNVLRIQRRAAAAAVFASAVALSTVLLNIFFVVILKQGVTGVFYAQLAASVGAAVWTLFLFRRQIDPRRFSFGRWKQMFAFSFPLLPGSIAFWAVNFSGVFFIQALATTSEVGLYQVGISVAAAMALLTQAFQMAWGPFAFSIHKREDAGEIYADALLLYLGAACTAALLITLFAREILIVLTTEDYYAAGAAAGILSFNYLFIGLGYVASTGTALAKNNLAYGIAAVASALLLVGLNYLLIPRFGIEGAALATAASQALIPLIVFRHAQMLYPIPYDFFKAALVVTAAAGLGFGAVYFMEYASTDFWISLAIKLAAAAAFAAFLFYLLDLKSYAAAVFTKFSNGTAEQEKVDS
mgnify:CR=1 FL=1|jgi:O-antigen/teichoic acid export membrane protein